MGTALKNFALKIGSDLATFKILFSIILAYPIAACYWQWMKNRSRNWQYAYFTFFGLGFMYFNFGYDTIQSILSILFIFAILKFIPGTSWSVFLSFTGLMTHLLYGYYAMSQFYPEYDLSWTLPHCVLTLRLIGLVWDVYDGKNDNFKTPNHNNTAAIQDPPDLLELFAYSYMFCSVLVGPQYSLIRLRSLVNGEFDSKKVESWRSLKPALTRLFLGILCISIYFSFTYDARWFISQDFKLLPFYRKMFHLCIWGKVFLHKYIAVWLMTEGACILSGLAYNGLDEKTGRPKWDGVRNVNLRKFEFGCTHKTMIEGFNYNTNQWMLNYIYKRVRFQTNHKSLRMFLTMLFLALWHGLHSGYFAAFLFEFFYVMAATKFELLLPNYPQLYKTLNSTDGWFLPSVLYTIKNFILLASVAWGAVCFSLLKFELWWEAYKSLYFYGFFIYVVAWPILYTILIASQLVQSKFVKNK